MQDLSPNPERVTTFARQIHGRIVTIQETHPYCLSEDDSQRIALLYVILRQALDDAIQAVVPDYLPEHRTWTVTDASTTEATASRANTAQ